MRSYLYAVLLLTFCIAAGCSRSGSVNAVHSPGQGVSDASGDSRRKQALELALQKKPGHVPVLLQLAKMESESDQLKKAEEHLLQVLRSEPSSIEARLELGRIQFQMGDVEHALENTQAILQANPEQPDALYNLGAIYGNLGDSRRAMEYWNRLIASHPDSESGKRARQFVSQLQRRAS